MANDALARAIQIAGGQTALAALIGVTQGHVWFWMNRAKKGVPADYCPAIERATGVTIHELRPDAFGTSQDPMVGGSIAEVVVAGLDNTCIGHPATSSVK